MKRWQVALLATLSACAPSPAPTRARVAPKPAQSLFLNEPFRVGPSRDALRCTVSDARAELIESSVLPYASARVRPDVPAIDVALRCENAQGSLVPSREALPLDTLVLLASGAQERAARPLRSSDTRDHWLFELPERAGQSLPARRRYDVDSGRLVVPQAAAAPAKLVLRGGALAVEVTLRQRFQDAELDRVVDGLASDLTRAASLQRWAFDSAGVEALTQLQAIYGEVRERFQPARLELSQVSAAAQDSLRITLSLIRPRKRSSAFEVARFELGLARGDAGSLGVRSFDNRLSARAALACDELEEQLSGELADHTPAPRGETCNALGLLLPAACSELAPALLTRALEVGARCRLLFSELKRSQLALPREFQLSLRRGRPERGFDKSARYVVVLFHTGQVVFHGKHWVSSKERSDGRTQLALLSGLYEHLRALDWFGRRGGRYDQDHCSPGEDLGDVISVVTAEQQRMVLDREGCRGPFSASELAELRRHVELVAGVSGWTEPRPAYVDQDVEHWAIAE